MTEITEIIPSLGTPPSTADPDNFDADADAFLGALPAFRTSLNTYKDQANTVAGEVNANSALAVAAAADAVATGNTEIWVSGGPFLVEQVRYSPTNFLNYKCIVANSGTTDPKDDTTNWRIHNDSVAAQIADASPSSASTHTFNYAEGQFQEIQAPNAGSLTIAFDNLPTGVLSAFHFSIIDGGDCAITWPASTEFENKIEPVLTENGRDWLSAYEDKDGVVVITKNISNIGVPA